MDTHKAALLSELELAQHFAVEPLTGLQLEDCLRRQHFHGPNELASDEKEPLWKKFLDKLREPMIMLLMASAGISLLMRQLDDAISIAMVSNI